MPTTITGVASPSDPGSQPSATCPADLDTGNAASVNGTFQTILNAIGWLRQNAVFGLPSKTTVSQNDTSFFYQPGGTSGWQGSASRQVSYWRDRGQVRMWGGIVNVNNSGTSQVLTFPSGFRPLASTPVRLRHTGTGALYTGTVSGAGVLTMDASAPVSSSVQAYDLDAVTFPTF